MKKIFLLCAILILCTNCSEFALLMSGASIAANQSAYERAYSGADVVTIMSTEKSIKKHAYDKMKETIDDRFK